MSQNPGVLLLCSALLIAPLAAAAADTVQARDLGREQKRLLDKDWEFYWQTGALDIEVSTVKPVPYPMPHYWNDLGFPVEGYGTYRLSVRLPERIDTWALRFESVLTAYRVWVNGREVGGYGTPGTRADLSVPGKGPGILFFSSPADGLVDIRIEVSNFHYRKSGILEPPVLMHASKAYEESILLRSRELILAGGLLIMALYHLGIWLLRPKDRSPLWFSLFCLGVLMRFMVTGEYVMQTFFPDFSWELGKKFEFLIFNLTGIPFMFFLSSLFPTARLKVPEWIVFSTSVLAGLFVILFPVVVTNHFVIVMEGFILLAFAYYLVVLARAVAMRLPGALLFIMGIVVLLGGAVHDILTANQIIMSGYILPITFFAVIVLQSFVLSRNFASSFAQAEHLSDELGATNLSLRRFIPQEFFRLLGRSEVQEIALGDMVQKEMTIMFTDLRGFTAMSEQMSPSQTFAFLNSFFGRMGAVVRKHSGFIDKYLGDGFLALYPRSPDDAIKAAVEIQREIVVYNSFREKSGYQPIELGIGIHHGRLTLGTVGEAGRMDTTVIADSVNLASRLEALTKAYGKGTIATFSFLDLLQDPEAYHWRYLGKVRVQGRSEAIEAIHIYDGIPDVEYTACDVGKRDFEEALGLYRQGELLQAEGAFAGVLEQNPADRASRTYLTRIRFLLEKGLPEDWDAVEMTSK